MWYQQSACSANLMLVYDRCVSSFHLILYSWERWCPYHASWNPSLWWACSIFLLGWGDLLWWGILWKSCGTGSLVYQWTLLQRLYAWLLIPTLCIWTRACKCNAWDASTGIRNPFRLYQCLPKALLLKWLTVISKCDLAVHACMHSSHMRRKTLADLQAKLKVCFTKKHVGKRMKIDNLPAEPLPWHRLLRELLINAAYSDSELEVSR